jgi:hypothetical protein
LVGPDASLEALKRTLITRTEGKPLFLEESVRTLEETGALIGERGAYRLAQDPQQRSSLPWRDDPRARGVAQDPRRFAWR